MILCLSVFHPRRKEPCLAVVPVIRKPHFRPDEQNLGVEKDNSTIVDDIFVHDWPVFSLAGVMEKGILHHTFQRHREYRWPPRRRVYGPISPKNGALYRLLSSAYNRMTGLANQTFKKVVKAAISAEPSLAQLLK